MPKKRNQQYWESMKQLNCKMQKFEEKLIKVIAPIFLDGSKNILEIEKEMLSATEKVFGELSLEFLNEIATVITQFNNEINYEKSNDGWIYNTSTEKKKEMDQTTYEEFKKCQDCLECAENIKLDKSTISDNDFQYKEKISKFIRDILKNDPKTLDKLCVKESIVRDDVYWQEIKSKLKKIKNLEEELQKNINDFINNNCSTDFVNNKIKSFVKEIKKIIKSMDQKSMSDKTTYSLLTKYSQPSDSELSTQKNKDEAKIATRNAYFKKYVKNNKNLIDNLKEEKENNIQFLNDELKDIRQNLIQSYITNSNGKLTENDFIEEKNGDIKHVNRNDNCKFLSCKKRVTLWIAQEKEKYNRRKNNVEKEFFNKKILSPQHKEKLAQKLEKELQSLEKEKLKKEILKYFEEIKEDFFDIFDEKLNNLNKDIQIINVNYTKNLQELNKRQNLDLTNKQKNELKKINQEMTKKRITAFSNFENEIRFLLPKLDNFTTYGYHTLEVFRRQLLINKDILPEDKKKYQEMSSPDKFNEIKDEIKKQKKDLITINENRDTLHEHFHTLEIKNKEKEISEALITGINQKAETFVTKNSGKLLDKKVVEKIVFLEKELLVNKKLDDISRGIKEWDTGINNLFNIKKEIKKQKPYKNLTTLNKTKVVSKNGILNFKPFPNFDNNANRRAQFLLVTEFRKTKITEYLAFFNMKKHTFENTIGKFTTLPKNKKSIWDKIVSCINGLKQIKNAYHKLRQWLNPKVYLKKDINTIKQSKTKLNHQIDNIKIKYAKVMAIPLEERSIFTIGKTDQYYLTKAKAEIEKVISQFENKNKEKVKFYERWADKQTSNYDSNKPTMQKITTILEFFTKNEIKDANNNKSKYQFATIKKLEQVLTDRLEQPDYKPQALNENMKKIIECANDLSTYTVAHFKDEKTFFPTCTQG